MMVLFLFSSLILTRYQCLSSSGAPIYFLISSTEFSQSVWMVDYLKVNLSLPGSMLEYRGLMKLERLSGEDLDFYSWWIRLSEKLAFSCRMYLVTDMAKDTKREIRPNTLGLPSLFLYLYWTILIFLSPEMWRFTYSGIMQEDCEGTPRYYPFGEARVSASRLN